MKKLLITAAALGLTIGFVATASATNGYFSHAYSIKNKGMAGAGVAAPMDAMVPSTNPAGLTEVGNRLDLGLSIFNPNREYSVDAPGFLNGITGTVGTVESDSNYFFIPNVGWSLQLNENTAIGLAMYGNGGMNTDYPIQTFQDPTTASTGVNLMQLFFAGTYAAKVAENHSIGVTYIFAKQYFSAKGLTAFGAFSSDPTNISQNEHDNAQGFGGRIGYFGKLTDQFNIGVSYQSKISMDEFQDYAGLFAESGGFDIPSNWTAGFAYMPTPELTIAVDVQQIFYSDVDSIGHEFFRLFLGPNNLGTGSGAGFGWDDMTIFKIGLQWDRTEKWSYRFGYSYGEQPIESTEIMFNILAPGVIEQHASFGFTYTFENQSELDFSLTYAFENDVTGVTPLAFGGQNVTLTMNQWEVGVGYSWKF